MVDEAFEMRKHLASILTNRALEPFPEREAQRHRHIPMINQITAKNVHLTDDTMDLIGQIIEENCPNRQYGFQSTILATVECYSQHARENDGMQFLYEGNGIDPLEIGHWIFLYYSSSTNKLHIYNSLNANTLTAKDRRCIGQLYPYIDKRNDVIYEKLRNRQGNGVACGVYAASYAISKALGKDPSEIDFKMSQTNDEVLHLRCHLAKIVRDRILLPFPESNT